MLDTEITFVSKFYTPTLKLSTISNKILKEMKNGKIPITSYDVTNNTIVNKIENTNIKSQAPRIYLILQTIILEAYSLVNTFLENEENIEYISANDILIVRDNINYVCDYLADYPEYASIISDLRNLELNFGYIEKQLGVIKGEVSNEI
ncbi:hypothetical protein Alsa3_CDS0023 [Staphylococcus phage Alsa_3]|nr:hypothetical protein Alsa3_CDS0023 [Staphylococcus phage Alsa_3]WNM51142.1 hypothetical protein Alsa4_CDS0012 [Staphylococcus phage Alsa_4]